MRRMSAVIARPMIGSAIGAPSATTMALSTMPTLTMASLRAWWPSAISAALLRRRPPLSRGGECVADHAGEAEGDQVVGRQWVHDALNRERAGSDRTRQDRADDGQTGGVLGAARAQHEGGGHPWPPTRPRRPVGATSRVAGVLRMAAVGVTPQRVPDPSVPAGP